MLRIAQISALAGLVASGCLIEPNPDFDEPGAEADSDSDDGDPTTSDGDPTSGETASGDGDGDGDPGDGDPGDGDPGEPCPDDLLDCDDRPGCEASASDPLTCGSCEHSCELAGQLLDCEAGVCSGSVVLPTLADTHVTSAVPDMNFADETSMWVSTTWGTEQAYIDFVDLAALSPDAVITAASLDVFFQSTGDPLALHRVEEAWVEAELTWANQPDLGPPLLSIDTTWGEASIDLLPVFTAWVGDPPSHGIALLPEGTEATEIFSRETNMGPSLSLTLSW